PCTMRRFSTVLLSILVSLVLLGSSGCTVFSDLIGSEKRDVYKFDHPFTVSDPAFRRSLDTFATAMIPGNTAELLKNGDEIFPAVARERAGRQRVGGQAGAGRRSGRGPEAGELRGGLDVHGRRERGRRAVLPAARWSRRTGPGRGDEGLPRGWVVALQDVLLR